MGQIIWIRTEVDLDFVGYALQSWSIHDVTGIWTVRLTTKPLKEGNVIFFKINDMREEIKAKVISVNGYSVELKEIK